MEYVLLIVGQDGPYRALDEEATRAMYAAHNDFAAGLGAKGVLRGGAELKIENRVVRPQGKDRVVTTGPYSETAEGVGGYYVVEADDIDTAAEYAKGIPLLPTDYVEVRPISP